MGSEMCIRDSPISSSHFMQVYSVVEKEAQMNRTAQIIREIVLSGLSVYIRVCGDKNDEPWLILVYIINSIIHGSM